MPSLLPIWAQIQPPSHSSARMNSLNVTAHTPNRSLSSVVSIIWKNPTLRSPKNSSTSNISPLIARTLPPTRYRSPTYVRSTSYSNRPIAAGSLPSQPEENRRVSVMANVLASSRPSARSSRDDARIASDQVPRDEAQMGPSVTPSAATPSEARKTREIDASESSNSSSWK
ncbi:hypothetical protein ACHAWF_002504 [Thalassiosira exigua]